MKPSDLSPLFSDEEVSPQEIKRARRLIARIELEEKAKELHGLLAKRDYKDSDSVLPRIAVINHEIVTLVLELFPNE